LLIKYRYGDNKIKEYALKILKGNPMSEYVSNFCAQLLHEVKSPIYREVNNSSSLIIEFAEYLSAQQLHLLITTMLESPYRSIRNKAYGLFKYYDDELKELMLRSFLRHKDEAATDVISEHAPIHVLDQLFISLVSSTKNEFILRKVLFRLCEYKESYLPRLKEWHLISYYYFMAKHNKDCDWLELKEVYLELIEDSKRGIYTANDDRYKSLMLWSLAKVNQWEIIELCINQSKEYK